MAENRDIWVLLEAEENKLSRQSAALLCEAERLSQEMGGQLHAVFLGPVIEGVEREAGARGAAGLYLCANEALRQYDPVVYEQSLYELLKSKQPALLLALSSSLGSDLMPRLAAKLKAPLVPCCADIELLGDGDLQFVKPVHNGRLFAQVRCSKQGVKLATFLPERLTADDAPAEERAVAVTALPMMEQDKEPSLQVTGFRKADHRTIDISEAQVIVAVGRGLGAKERLAAVESFADSIGGAIGGTRPMVDEGILPYERQIGQTGKRVSPKLIILCGISGAIEFTQGVRNAGACIAINNDPQAPALASADLGIVGDLNQLLPQLQDHVVRMTKTGSAGMHDIANGGQSK